MDKNTIKKKNTKSIDKIIDNYIIKICKFDNQNKTFDEKLKNISILTDNLIDYCIKKKIFYFIDNKISYSSIVYNFKSYLAKFIKDIVDPNNNIINKYIINTQEDNISMVKMGWDNVSDINSVIFKNFKNLNESFEKNVSFETKNDFNNKDLNNDKLSDKEDDENLNSQLIMIDDNNVDSKILPIYIKLLINQNKYLIEFTDKLIFMCEILSNEDIKYKKNNPYNQ